MEKSLKEGHRLQVPLPAASREWDGKDTEGIMWEWVMEGPAEELELSEERGHHCWILSGAGVRSWSSNSLTAGVKAQGLLGKDGDVTTYLQELS